MSKIQPYSGDLTAEQIDILSKAAIIPANTPPAIVSVFAQCCKEHGLSPFKKEIYLTLIGGKYVTMIAIDGMRIKAARTGQYAGFEDAKYNLKGDGYFQTAAEVKQTGKNPVTCTVTVYRAIAGVRCPFTKTVVFDEFSAPARNAKWKEMPFQMIAKVAESFALKTAFGDETSGLHIEEETAAFEGATIQAAQYRPAVEVDVEQLKDRLADCYTKEALMLLYGSNPAYATDFADLFTERKNEIAELAAKGQIPQP